VLRCTSELEQSLYGPSTASAVLAYKQSRDIINRSYQTQADDIVGKMTMRALDDARVRLEESDDDLTIVEETASAIVGLVAHFDRLVLGHGLYLSQELRLRFDILRRDAFEVGRGHRTPMERSRLSIGAVFALWISMCPIRSAVPI
jgi:hypothetical protein